MVSTKKTMRDLLEKVKDDEEINIVNSNPDKYQDIIDEYGITDKLNNIIDDFDNVASDGSSLYNKLDLNIGIICDEFLYYSLENAANFIYIPFSEIIEVNEEVDVLMVVSSWRGVDHSWDYIANPSGRVRGKLLELIKKYKEKNKPTIFYSKEDPVSYKQYLSIAKESDYIFTSAFEVVDDYKRDTNNNNVHVLEFGVNPLYHNPIGKNLNDKSVDKIVTFAGSWMVRFPERNQEALQIFEGVNKSSFSLSIIDRQYERKMERYHFPSFLIKNISATIPHERLMKLHKATRWGINLNSVKDSKTMFANRVLELQAMGNVILSNYNKGIHSKFPNIFIVNNKHDVECLLNKVTLQQQKEIIADGISNVMLKNTSYHIVNKIATALKYDYRINSPKILVIGENENSRDSFERQTYKNSDYINKIDLASYNRQDDYDFYVYFSNNLNYNEQYLQHLLSTFAYTNADIVTMNENGYFYVDNKNYIESQSMIKYASCKPFQNIDKDLIFFNIPKTELNLNNSYKNKEDNNKLISIIINVNDEFKSLEYKSILSLYQADVERKVEVILLTDKKLKEETKQIVERMARKFSFIRKLSVDKKNKTEFQKLINEDLQSKYLMFLDEENQVMRRNFKEFIQFIEKDNDKEIYIGKSFAPNSYFVNGENNGSDLITLINRENLSIESMVINKDLFIENISLFNNSNKNFLLKLIMKSEKIKFFDKFVHYHLKEEIKLKSDIDILRESLLFERNRFNILSEFNLLEDYVNDFFDTDFLSNYFKLFKKCSSSEKAEALDILSEVVHMYENYYDRNNKQLNEILELLF